MLGATLLKLVKLGTALSGYEWLLIALGFVLSFVFAYAVIKVFMNYIKKARFQDIWILSDCSWDSCAVIILYGSYKIDDKSEY